MSENWGMVVTSLRELAERIVEGRNGIGGCPCCGYDGLLYLDREKQIAAVLDMLTKAVTPSDHLTVT
jgi:hypothetical protein